jgi:hypothetical protein
LHLIAGRALFPVIAGVAHPIIPVLATHARAKLSSIVRLQEIFRKVKTKFEINFRLVISIMRLQEIFVEVKAKIEKKLTFWNFVIVFVVI